MKIVSCHFRQMSPNTEKNKKNEKNLRGRGAAPWRMRTCGHGGQGHAAGRTRTMVDEEVRPRPHVLVLQGAAPRPLKVFLIFLVFLSFGALMAKMGRDNLHIFTSIFI